jgi:hypothetical protein
MGIETGDSISFILSIFTVILSIASSIVVPKANDLPPTNLALFQATIDLMQNKSLNNTFFAKNLLHNSTKSGPFVIDDNIPNYNISRGINDNYSTYDKIANAIKIYNDESTNGSVYDATINNLNKNFSIPCQNLTEINNACKEIWFANRLLELENNRGHNVNEDYFNCREIMDETHKCSYIEVQNLKNISSQMDKGFVNYFYNERNINLMQKPIESYVSGLNNFFILTLLSGPAIFLTYIERKSDSKREKK